MKSSISKIKKQVQRGFTLVEIAIVLVIIGLMIGGVLRGQELINSGRVRNLVTQQSGIQTAYYAFLDRYKFMPGNMSTAQVALINTSAVGIGTASANTSNVTASDSPVVFNNLAHAGFITCSTCMTIGGLTGTNPVWPGLSTMTTTGITSANSPVNTFGNPLYFFSNAATTAATATGAWFFGVAGETSKPSLVTGNGINTNLLAELDRKIDDGIPATGTFRYSDVYASGLPSSAAIFSSCVTGQGAASTWTVSAISPCQGLSQF